MFPISSGLTLYIDDFFLAKNIIVAEWDYVAPKGGSRVSINNSFNLYCIMVEDVRVYGLCHTWNNATFIV